MIKKYFFPDKRVNSISDIDARELFENGIRLVLLDIDNTLVPYTMPTPDERAIDFLNSLKENNIEFCFVSNNNEKRIDLFNKNIGARTYPRAKKPLLCGICKAMNDFKQTKENTALIGDQVFTDIFGGKRAGIMTILVEPIKEVDTLFFRFKRYFEKKVLKKYDSITRNYEKNRKAEQL